MQILVSLELLPIQISSQGFLGKRVSQTYWATDPICESAFSQTLILPRINFSAQPAWQRYTKRKINKIGCFTIKKKTGNVNRAEYGWGWFLPHTTWWSPFNP